MTKIILDITHPGDGNMTRHILSLPVTIGRAFDNDIILDDPFVDPHHARIEIDPASGEPVLRDLESKNGILHEHKTRRSIALQSGASFTLGRSDILYYTPSHTLTPTLPLERQRSWQRKIQQPLIVWPLYFLTIAVITGWSYLNIWSDEVAPALSTAAVMTGSVILAWSAAWALVGRLVRRRAQFAAHVGVACLYTLVCAFVWTIQSYVNFLSNENWIAHVFDYGVSFMVLSCLLMATLALATTMLAARRRNAAMISTAGILFGSLAFSLISAKSFDTEAHYAVGIEPHLTFLAPAITPEKLLEEDKKLFKSKVFSQKTAQNP